MRSFTILETRPFMSMLFAGALFHDFEVVEADIVTFAAIHVDGTFYPEYYDQEDTSQEEQPAESQKRFIPWSRLQPYAFELIRGKHTPVRLKLVLRLPDILTEQFLQQSSLPFSPADIAGLYLNITYDREHVVCISGLSTRLFTMDQSLTYAWDEKVRDLLAGNHIAIEEQ